MLSLAAATGVYSVVTGGFTVVVFVDAVDSGLIVAGSTAIGAVAVS